MASNGIARLTRLTTIMTLLQSRRIITAQNIADKFGISIRTAYRDIRVLEEAGIPIVTEEGKGYSLMQGYLLPPVMFTEAEANALVTAEKIIETNTDTSLKKNYDDAISKIRSIMRHSMKDKADLLSDRIQIRNNFADNQASNYLSLFQTAITHFRAIQIDYTSETGDSSKRIIEPLALYSTQGNWVLIAFCRLRKEHRAFRLDRIKSHIELNEYFAPHNFSLQDFFEECKRKYYPTPDTPLS